MNLTYSLQNKLLIFGASLIQSDTRKQFPRGLPDEQSHLKSYP